LISGLGLAVWLQKRQQYLDNLEDGTVVACVYC
jgi:hypothetical protein